MRRVKLPIDLRILKDGKRVLYKKGETVQIEESVYDHIMQAVAENRQQMRDKAKTTLGTPEWKMTRDR